MPGLTPLEELFALDRVVSGPVGGLRRPPKEEDPAPGPRRRPPPWGRLILRTWQGDPETCRDCGRKMKRSRALLDRRELERLLVALNLYGYPARPPPAPPPAREPATAGPGRLWPTDSHSQQDPRPSLEELPQLGWEE